MFCNDRFILPGGSVAVKLLRTFLDPLWSAARESEAFIDPATFLTKGPRGS